MSFFQWRRFNFFDISKDVDGGKICSQLGEDTVITCSTSGRGSIVLGDSKGTVWTLSRHWDVAWFPGWSGRVDQLLQPRQTSFLLGLGLEGTVWCLKVWNLDKLDKAEVPQVSRISRLSLPGSTSSPVCFGVSENLMFLAIGYDNGTVVLYRGDVTKEKGTKQKTILEGPDPISGLSFRITNTGVFLYVATEKDVFLLNVTTRERETKIHLDSLGCERGLSVAASNQAETQFVTGRSDAVYCYTPEGRGQCYAFEGKKKLLNWFRNYLTVVTEDGTDKAIVTVFDVQNKFIGFSSPMKPVLSVLPEWGSLFIISVDGKIHQLLEKDTQSKLSLLFKKNFYDVAIKIAKNQHYDSDGLVDIFRQYGDHLYAKGDHAGAIEQYVKTIGTLEPSYVIRKFLDAQKIHHLTAYLQSLHRLGLASEDHTTLLLNCYTKLKDCEKLDEFIMTKDRDVDFDVDIAINVCRQAGYCNHALALAEKHTKHDLYLKIQIENQGEYKLALNYISKLENLEADCNMKKYGAVLMQEVPEETSKFLQYLCLPNESVDVASNPEDFIYLFINNPEGMVEFLEHIVNGLPKVTSSVYNTLIEYYLYALNLTTDLEKKRDKEKKVMGVLRSDRANYDSDQALVLCQLNHFQEGLLFLYQKAELYDQILKYHFQSGNHDAGVAACRRFGTQNPQLWVTALQHVASSGGETPQHHFREVLDNIEKHRLLSPLLVVSTLSSCPTATLGVVRDYLMRTLETEEGAMAEDKKMIEQYRTDTARIRGKIDELNSSVTIFQSTKCSACNHPLELPTVHFLCQHGYHQHCFQSFSESDKECPACHQENKKILDIIKSQEAGRNQHDQFHAQLEKAEDGFSIVAEYFGRGMFSQPVSVSELENIPPARVVQPPQSLADTINNRTISEGRLRSNVRTTPAVDLVSEGRLRADGRGNPGGMATHSEARLRAGERGNAGGVAMHSEARLRAGEASLANTTVSSDARMRLTEGRRGQSPGLSGRGQSPGKSGRGQSPAQSRRGQSPHSLSANLTREVEKTKYRQPLPQVPAKKDIIVREANPFSEPESANPFGSPAKSEDLGEDNPFAESNPFGNSPAKASGSVPTESNPFGEDDYDEELNPFA